MTPNLSAIEVEIARIQANLNEAQTRHANVSAVFANALSQRPAGIPSSWLPDFTLSAGTANVKAWFDPAFFGNSLRKNGS